MTNFEGADYLKEHDDYDWQGDDASGFEAAPTDSITSDGGEDDGDIEDRAPDELPDLDLTITAPISDMVAIDSDTVNVTAIHGPRQSFETGESARITNAFEPSGNVSFAWMSDSATLFMQCQPSAEESRGAEIGGVGITRRPLDHVEGEIPGISMRLRVETGKVVFLGNGLSTAALEAYQDWEPGTAPERVLVDAIDYRSLHSDLHALRGEFDARLIEVPPSLEDALAKCDALIEAADNGLVHLVQHVVGSSEMPEIARNADLAVNVFGPPPSTLQEQLSCLKPTGSLWLSSPVPPRTDALTIPITKNGGPVRGYVIRPGGR